jgi:hypothetical protein
MALILYWLAILVFLLLVFFFMLVRYVGIPLALLVAFFRSEWAPRSLKNIVAAVLSVLLLLWGAYLYLDKRHRRAVASRPRPQPVRLTVRQPGLLPYPLGRGGIEQARYDTVRLLVVSGDLPTGSQLRARFVAGPGFYTPNETNRVAVSTDEGDASQATGRTIYEPRTRSVTGEFRCVLPSGQRLSVSFPPTPVVLRQNDAVRNELP